MPEHVGVAEVGYVSRKDGVLVVFHERLAAIGAVGHALCLVGSSRSVESHYRSGTKAGGVVLVYHTRAAEYGAYGIGFDSCGLRCPVNEIS